MKRTVTERRAVTVSRETVTRWCHGHGRHCPASDFGPKDRACRTYRREYARAYRRNGRPVKQREAFQAEHEKKLAALAAKYANR